MDHATSSETKRAMAHLHSGLFVLTAQFEIKRAGTIVRSVQVCADEPPLVCVSIRRGHWIEPVIRDSHAFAVCKIAATERLMVRKFSLPSRPREGDLFDCVPVERLVTGSPIIVNSSLVLDCEVVRHFDLEADHELFVGRVVGARFGNASGAAPKIDTFQQSLDLHSGAAAGASVQPVVKASRPPKSHATKPRSA